MNKTKAVSAYRGAKRRLLLLDYDGVLAPIVSLPELAQPSAHIRRLLTRFADDPHTVCVIISGRPRDTLEEWLGDLPLEFAAEHGLWRRDRSGVWGMTLTPTKEWKSHIRAALESYAQKLPGAFVEEKYAAVGLHYRNVDAGLLGALTPLMSELRPLAERFGLRILEGKKVIEVLLVGVDKGTAAQHWIERGPWDFILAAGDDVTDESLFAAVPYDAFSVKVGEGVTAAKAVVKSQPEFERFLEDLTSA